MENDTGTSDPSTDGDVAENDLVNLLEGLDLSGEEIVTEEGGQEAEEEEAAEEEAESSEVTDTEESNEESDDKDESDEEEEEVEPEDEEEESEEEESDSDDESNGSKKVQKRFDELTRKRREAEEERDGLKTKLAELEAQQTLQQTPVATGDYDHLSTVQEVQSEYDRAQEIIEWAEDNAEGVVVTKKDGSESEYSADDVKNIKRNARRARERGLPDRFRYLQASAEMDKVAVAKYPALSDTSSELSKEVERIVKARPALKQIGPEYRLMTADWLRGKAAREAEETAAKKPKKVLKKKNPKKVPIKRRSKATPAKAPKIRRGSLTESDLASALEGIDGL